MLDWQQLDTVFLDMDGTLLDLHFDNYFWLQHVPEVYAESQGISLDESQKRLTERFARERGTLKWYCVDYWSHELDLDIVQLKKDISHKIAYRPQVPEFLEDLARNHCRTLIVTNAHPKVYDLKHSLTDVGAKVDRVISSHDFGQPKENPDFWRELNEVEPFNADKTLLIDDSFPVLRAARDYGIHYLFSIHQPDSQNTPRLSAPEQEFPCIEQFYDLMPTLVASRPKSD